LGAVGTLTAACGLSQTSSKRRVAVVGGGIIGASTALHLARAGASVAVLERGEIAGRASQGTFAWLNASWAKQPRHYHRLNQLGIAGWQELEGELSIPIKWGGSLEWFGSAERQAQLATQIAEQVEWGEPARMVLSDELAELEPKVEFGTATDAALSPNDGAVDPVLAAQMMLENAASLGADIRTQCDVTGVVERDGVSTLATSQGDIEADFVVLATGADPDATQALAGATIPQRTTPGVIVITKPFAPVLNRILVAPGVHIHQRLDGRIVLGEQDGAPDTEAHAARLADRPTQFPSPEFAAQHAARIMAVAEQYLPGISAAEVEDVHIGWRPLPTDGHPVMGFAPANPGTYIAIAHSGVTLAPILGRLAAQEILEGITLDMLSPYRPDRAFEEVRRY